MPNHVFDGQRMGSMSARDNQIQACEQNGNTPSVNGVPVVAPHIVQSPNQSTLLQDTYPGKGPDL